MSARLAAMTALLVLAPFAPAQATIAVRTAKLGHGVEAWYASNPSVPVVDVLLSFEGAGTASDTPGKEGRAAMAADMLTEGAGDMDALGFQRALLDKAISLDAIVYPDRMVVHVHALRDVAPRAGELLALALTKPRFADADMARIKTQMLARLKELAEDPDYLAGRAFNAQAFAGHPYANALDGTAQSIAGLSPQDMRDFVASHLARANLQVTAAGDLDTSALGDLLDTAIEALPADTNGVAPLPPIAMQGAGSALSLTQDVPQSVVVFGTPAPARDDPKFYTAYLLNQIVGGNPLVSRLGDVVRQKKGLVYNIDTELDVRSGISLLRGSFATRTESATEATAAFKQTLMDLHDKGATLEECNEARTYALGAFARELDGSASVAGTLLMMRIYHLGQNYIDKRSGYFNAVSCDDINALAKELLDPQHFLLVTVGRTAATGGTP